jgi:hypothetical protein
MKELDDKFNKTHDECEEFYNKSITHCRPDAPTS